MQPKRSDEDRFRQFAIDLDKAVHGDMGIAHVVTPSGKRLPDLTNQEVRDLIEQLQKMGLL